MDDNRQFEDIPDNADADTGDYISSEELEKAVKRRKKWIIIGILAVLVIAGAALLIWTLVLARHFRINKQKKTGE